MTYDGICCVLESSLGPSRNEERTDRHGCIKGMVTQGSTAESWNLSILIWHSTGQEVRCLGLCREQSQAISNKVEEAVVASLFKH